MLLTGSPHKCMEKMLGGRITRFTEYRVNSMPFWADLTGLPLYHTYSVMETWKSFLSFKWFLFPRP